MDIPKPKFHDEFVTILGNLCSIYPSTEINDMDDDEIIFVADSHPTRVAAWRNSNNTEWVHNVMIGVGWRVATESVIENGMHNNNKIPDSELRVPKDIPGKICFAKEMK